MDRAKSTLFGASLVALALAIVAYASSSVKPSPLTNFRISGDATAPLYPGSAAPVDLGFTNPNTFSITVSNVAVTVAGNSRAACDTSNFVVGSQFAGTVRLAPYATASLSQLGIPQSAWPRVAMVDSPSNQDACKGSSVKLSYTGQATASVHGESPAGLASGPVYINGHLFSSGGIHFGARALIKPGGRLELHTHAGRITVYPPAGKSIRFVIRRAVVPSGRLKGGAKPKSKPLVELQLTGGGLSRCASKLAAHGVPKAPPAGTPSPPVRSLWAKGNGRLRVRGRFAVSTGRNGWWLTRDSCHGTLVKVRKSTIRVDDITRQSPVFVKAGDSYLAEAGVKVALTQKAGRP